MKNTGFVLLIVGLLILGSSCVSSGKAALLEQREPIALVSVVSNNNINWKDEDPVKPDSFDILAGRALKRDADLTIAADAGEIIIAAEIMLRDAIVKSALLDIADNGTVLDANAYQIARTRKYQSDRGVAVPASFRPVDYRDKNFYSALAAETGIQRSMFVEFNLTTVMTSGIAKYGNARALVDMAVRIVDAQGKTIYFKEFSLRSYDTFKVSGGAYSRSEVDVVFESAIGDIYLEFLEDLAK